MSQILDVLRKEKKFVISNVISTNLSNFCGKVLKEDSHNDSDGYCIRSLYFDTYDNGDYESKLSGDEIRRKIRIRIYNTKDKIAKLEMKQKQGDNQRKRSLSISREEARKLIDGDFLCLLEMNDPFANELYTIMTTELYRPKCVVEYHRKAFIVEENSTRVTLDSDIRASEACFDIFDEQLCLYPVYGMEKVVLEVKYNNFLLSYVKDIINSVDKIETSVSKYCLARSASLGGEA